jgi:acetyl-CoA carboxylase biotin carboxylase subunit
LSKNVLIANRGEIAIRIVRTCRRLDLKPFGIFSDADKSSLHIKQCEKALNIGGFTPSESYLNMDKIIDAAKQLGCELVHPGYGFLSENSNFAMQCKKEGLTFIGPSYETMSITGDKARSRRVASKITSIVDGDEISSERSAIELAEKIGYPVILKAVQGGGGRGLRIIRSFEELKEAFAASKNEAMISFGSDRIYMEKYIENPRHIEVQVLADDSKIIHLGERECSIQRRHQKLIEETPSPALTVEMRNRITKTAIAIMKEVGYTNAGTVEFLFKNNRFYFMEVNARIQVEHPITEAVTGVDIVEEQLRIALGNGLSIKQENIRSKGHAIECRINSEHPISFIPFSGTVTKFIVPSVEGIRVDTAIYPGYSIPVFYDSLIAKIISVANSRLEAIEKMKRSLISFRISGIPSTIPFHISALNDARFVNGNYDTSFINQMTSFSSKDGEIAAALLSFMPKRIEFLKNETQHMSNDPWMMSRHDYIDTFDRYVNIKKWII